MGEATAPTFQLDRLVAGAAEWMRAGETASDYDLDDVAELADELALRLPPTEESHEFLELLDQAARLAR